MRKLATFASLLFLSVITSQLNAQGQCTNATMHGVYAMSASGSLGGIPVAVIARVVYDGRGQATAIETVSVGGAIYTDVSATGTFTVNSDCTGSKTFTSPLGVSNYNFVITPDGSRITWIETDSGTILNGEANRFREAKLK